MEKASSYKKKRSKKTFFQRLKTIGIILGILFLIGLIYWLIFYSSFFVLQEVKINFLSPNGENLITEEEIVQWLKEQNNKYLLPRLPESRSFVFLSQDELTRYLKKKYPVIDSLKIDLNLTASLLNLEYTLKEEEFLLCFPDDPLCFILDKDGVPFKQVEANSSDLLKIYLERKIEIQLGDPCLSLPFNKIKELETVFQNNPDVIKIKYLSIENEKSSEFTLMTEEGMKIYLNFNEDFEKVMTILKSLKEKQFSGSFKGIEYLDLRYLPKIYYQTL